MVSAVVRREMANRRPESQAPAVGDHPARDSIAELITAWREQVRRCRSLDTYQGFD